MNSQNYTRDYAEKYTHQLAQERTSFIKKTYMHLAMAIVFFAAIECFLLSWSGSRELAAKMTQGNAWLVVLGAFMLVSWIADSWARSATSLAIQYAGLTLYVVAEAIIFMPLMLVADAVAPGAIQQSAIITGGLVVGLTCTVFFLKKDFSFLRPAIVIASFVALGAIVCAILFKIDLGLWFSLAMVALAGAAILYQTSAVMRDYRSDQYVSAALGLFASIALLYWYILRILISRRNS